MTLNDLERQLTTVISVMRVVTKSLKLESCDFRCKIALYFSYLHIKFDDETERESLGISSIISNYHASKVKLMSHCPCYAVSTVRVSF